MSKLSRRPTVPQFNTYQSYKPYLREDFLYRCVYCSIHENEFGGPRNFTVEHFRPQKSFAHLINDYQNLLYGCNVCNPFKGHDWPSDHPLQDGVGYIDPCEYDYDDHFCLHGFQIEGLTPVAKYMVERLHLNRQQLVKIRAKRFDERADHLTIIQALHEQLNLLTAEIESAHLSPPIRQQFQDMKNAITNQLKHELEKWNHRWEPVYALADYR